MAGKKRQSKRQSLHKKHKIEKKVAAHHRKIRKTSKDHPELKSKKDPGIPNLWPFKEELLTQIENRRSSIADEKKKLKEKKLKVKKIQLETMASDAKKREEEFNRRQELKELKSKDSEFQKEPKDNSLKAFYREVKKVIEASDVILQVLDARDPMGCRSLEIEHMILERYPNKKVVLILNKIDLIPRENVVVWVKYLKNFFPTLAFKCSTHQQKRNLGQSTVMPEMASKDLLNSAESLGAENLLQLLKNYSRSLNIKTSVTVGIIGYPNVGKSSLINSLKRTRSVGVGATPGFTKVAQEVHLDKNVKLIDSPGIVPVRGSVDDNIILRNVVKIQKISDPIGPVETILSRCSKELILSIYQTSDFSTPTEFLTLLADKRKKFSKGGIPDLKRTALAVIEDWNGGKIPFYTLPPKDTSLLKTSIVSEFSNEFNIDQTELITSVSKTSNRTTFASYESKVKENEIDTSVFDDEVDEDMDDDDEDEDMEDDDEEEEDGMEEDDDEDEDDEDEDEEEDDEDRMIEDTIKSKFQTLPVKAQVLKQNANQNKPLNLADENDQYNPQTNQNKKKQLKKLKKKFGVISNSHEINLKQQQKSQVNNNHDDDDDEDDIDEDNVF